MSSVQINDLGHDVVEMLLDMPGKSANVLTQQVLSDLDEAVSGLEIRQPSGIVVRSAKPSIFVAGADLVAISETLDWSDREIISFCKNGQNLFRRISQLDGFSVAAIHGACVGGGMELTLWCDARIVSNSRRSVLGLPEVKLGLIPGWGGTARLPRLIGLEPAVDLITTGTLVQPERAKELGIVSEVVEEAELVPVAARLIDEARGEGNYRSTREQLEGPVRDLARDLTSLQSARQDEITVRNIEPTVEPHAPAVVLEHMIRTATVELERACQGEARAMTHVYGSAENRGLLHTFFLDERSKKVRGTFSNEADRIDVASLGVIGAGIMGRQISMAAAKAGVRVGLFDIDPHKSTSRHEDMLPQFADQVFVAERLENFGQCDMIIETARESLEYKEQLFVELESFVKKDCVLATNTSAIPLESIGKAMKQPHRLVGTHFCCPTESMRLVEIVASESNRSAVANAIEFVRKIRKTPVVVRDRTGFVVNRLLSAVIDESLSMLQQGVDVAEVDRPLKKFGFAVGPLEMIDFIGLDTIFHTGATLARAYPTEINASPVLAAMIKRGRRGRKTGRGFYRYENEHNVKECDPETDKILHEYRSGQSITADPETVLDRMLIPMVLQAESLLQEQVVDNPQDIDICSIYGTTFPAVRGGLLFWCHQLGRENLTRRAQKVQTFRDLGDDVSDRLDHLISILNQHN